MFHLIDADIDVLNVTREIISSAGFESLTFDSPAAYLEYVNSAVFTPAIAILTCYLMPEMNGYELVTEVRKKYPLQKALILTGSPTYEIPPDEENLVCCHLLKPYQPDTLLAALKKMNLCDRTCAENKAGDPFKPSCKFGLRHSCPFYIGPSD